MIALAACIVLHVATLSTPCARTPLPEPHPVATPLHPSERMHAVWRT